MVDIVTKRWTVSHTFVCGPSLIVLIVELIRRFLIGRVKLQYALATTSVTAKLFEILFLQNFNLGDHDRGTKSLRVLLLFKDFY